MSGPKRATSVERLALPTILIFATLLRLPGLDGQLWLDEIYAWLDHFRVPLAELVTHYRGDVQHTSYAVLANLLVSLLGEARWVVRLPAVLAGVAGIAATHFLVARFVDFRSGLLAAFLLAVSFHHVWFSQNARGYTLLAFLVMTSAHALLRILEDTKASRAHQALYAASVGLAVYTHLTMVFVAAGHLAVVLISTKHRRRLQPFLVALFAAALVSILLYGPMAGELVLNFVRKSSKLRAVSTPAWAGREAARVLSFGLSGVGLAIAALCGIAGLVVSIRARPALTAVLTLPVLTTVGGALLVRGTLYPRFFFFAAGAGACFVAAGAAELSRFLARGGRPIPGRALVGVLFAAGSASALFENATLPKQDFEGALRFVEGARAGSEPIVTAGTTVRPYRDYFGRSFVAVDDPRAFDQVRTSSSAWLLYSMPRFLVGSAPHVFRAASEECAESRSFRGTLHDGDVYACHLRQWPSH
ncbi:MAG: glycosyltransferase family 39 protein [Deltaproteobacteria bacterium]|nr:glycosyltransferase family 39 protein [Deltaproteobacteria bacterium]